MIQVPVNLFDTRLVRAGLLEELAGRGFTVFARSVYLKGLLVADPDSLPPVLAAARGPLLRLEAEAAALGLRRADLALAYVLSLPGVTSVVLGMETLDQLHDNVRSAQGAGVSPEVLRRVADGFTDLPEVLLDPRRWDR